MFGRIVASLTGGVFLVAPALAQDAELAFGRHVGAHIGQSIAAFILETGHTPAEAIPLSATRRAFVFYGQTVGIGQSGNGFVPDVAAASTCKVIVDADRVSTSASAEAFRIRSMTAHGPCGNFF